MDWGIMITAVALGAMLVLVLLETNGQDTCFSSTEGILPPSVGRAEPWMRKIIYVSGLPTSFTDERLRELFVSHGTVDITWVVLSRITGQSEGYGFVMMGTEEEAQEALSALSGTMVEGTLLLCVLASLLSKTERRGISRHPSPPKKGSLERERIFQVF